MERKDIMDSDTQLKVEMALAARKNWIAYNSKTHFFDTGSIELFRTKIQAISYAAVPREAGEHYHICHALTLAGFYRKIGGRNSASLQKDIPSAPVTDKDKTFRKMHVAMTLKDYERVSNLYEASACRTLSEYFRKVLLQKPVMILYRNQAAEDFLSMAIDLKNELHAAVRHLPQEDMQSDKQILTDKIDEISRRLTQLYELCSLK
jgi:hypothetical protein